MDNELFLTSCLFLIFYCTYLLDIMEKCSDENESFLQIPEYSFSLSESYDVLSC